MSVREEAPLGAPCWVDLYTSDADGARRFYADLFGWAAQDPAPDFGGYFNFYKGDPAEGGAPIAGCMPAQEGIGTPDVWSVYFATADAAQTVEAVGAAGGQVQSPAMPVGDLGVMATAVDPTGGAFGLWQPGVHRGFGLIAEHGAPGWFELHTPGYAVALDFYRKTLGWDTESVSDADEFRYTVVKDGEEQVAGVMDASAMLPAGSPGVWSVYFAVDDPDATIETVTARGGSVIRPAEDTPYGRLAEVADPAGAHFKLVGRGSGTAAG